MRRARKDTILNDFQATLDSMIEYGALLSGEISFEEAAFGVKRDISISRQENCETCGGSGAKLPHAAGNLGGHIGKNLRSLPAQQLHRLGRERQLVFFYNSERFGAGGFVRVGGAGSDHIQWIAQNIAEYDREHLCGGAGFGESATLYA